MCDTKREWNSFDRNIASRNGLPHRPIPVQFRPFRDLLRQYGTPFYLKVDIEGHDHYCVDDLDRADLPQCIPLEMGPLEMLFKLRDLGYERFKLITQNNHTCLAIDLFGTRERVTRQLQRAREGFRRRRRTYPGVYRVGQYLSQMGQALPFGRSLNPVHQDRRTLICNSSLSAVLDPSARKRTDPGRRSPKSRTRGWPTNSGTLVMDHRAWMCGTTCTPRDVPPESGAPSRAMGRIAADECPRSRQRSILSAVSKSDANRCSESCRK